MHGITKELSLLQNLIDRANEKGWRRELYEYLERKELLKKPDEQERLLLEVPNVIAEELEPEAIVQEPAEDENDVCGLPQLDIVGNRADKPFDVEADISLSNDDCTDTAGLHLHDIKLFGQNHIVESQAIVRKRAGLRQLDIVGNRAYIPFNIEADKSLSNDDFCSTDAAEQVESEAFVRKPAEDEKSSMCCPPESTFAGTWAEIPCDAILLESAQNERNNICCSTQITISRTSADLPSDAVADNCLPNNNFCNTSAAGAYFHDLNSLHRAVQICTCMNSTLWTESYRTCIRKQIKFLSYKFIRYLWWATENRTGLPNYLRRRRG
ncbi:hypothetical protein POM88_016539 [Heracleum sosnowskyi]|uniref:NERD domain-containing protein n=1 Tax=Heracleum sosnowskyi TaxID=360622 RepID=A0AAD8IP31_9APIA|nr:hypothetical protein POM88_016539 [Heracleum sosnowskyi]